MFNQIYHNKHSERRDKILSKEHNQILIYKISINIYHSKHFNALMTPGVIILIEFEV